MRTISDIEAGNRLSELLVAAENGEEIVITKDGRPVATLSAVSSKSLPAKEIDRARAREAAEWLIEFAKKHRLRGMKIKDLINEGRKY